MQLVESVKVASCRMFGQDKSVKRKSKIEIQKDKNVRIELLMNEYNKLARLGKLNENEVMRAKEILNEAKELGLFCKLIRC